MRPRGRSFAVRESRETWAPAGTEAARVDRGPVTSGQWWRAIVVQVEKSGRGWHRSWQPSRLSRAGRDGMGWDRGAGVRPAAASSFLPRNRRLDSVHVTISARDVTVSSQK